MCCALLVLSGCGSHQPAPVDQRREPPSQRINYHIVSRGETLFSIAWRYEKDLQKLAAANNLSSDYTIHPGQRLSLDTNNVVVRQKSEPNKAVSRIPKQTVPDSKPPTYPQRHTAAVTSPKTYASKGPLSWRWPVNGRVSRQYNAAGLFKGIDLRSLPGSAVTPAAPGTVVYAGDGLRGYGNLIIIRHDDVFLSAYAHNRKIFVSEGSAVQPGQKIAEVGGDPADVRRFYFEIRKDGKPVNPLIFLPKP